MYFFFITETARLPVLRQINDLRNLWLLGYLRMRQVFRKG